MEKIISQKRSPENELNFYAKDRDAWRKWHEKNNNKESNVWLILYRKASEIKSVNYAEAVEEALCFGWIDSLKKKRDDDSSYQMFGKRKPKSSWSKLNKTRVKELIKQDKMTPAGMEMITLAKKTGTWTALDSVDKLIIPDDLQKEFNKNKKSFENFTAFSPSSKKIILAWILSAKKPETRVKRIAETVDLARKNIKAHQ